MGDAWITVILSGAITCVCGAFLELYSHWLSVPVLVAGFVIIFAGLILMFAEKPDPFAIPDEEEEL